MGDLLFLSLRSNPLPQIQNDLLCQPCVSGFASQAGLTLFPWFRMACAQGPLTDARRLFLRQLQFNFLRSRIKLADPEAANLSG
jgi:hypothetical protein